MKADSLTKVAMVLNYKGPTISELISNETKKGGKISVNKNDESIEIIVENVLAYSLKIVDTYIYNKSEELIKQLLYFDNKVHVVFDKFEDAIDILQYHDNVSILVS